MAPGGHSSIWIVTLWYWNGSSRLITHQAAGFLHRGRAKKSIGLHCIAVEGYELRIGWMFLRHSLGCDKFSEITELYIWPIYRRMHLGTSLEEAAVSEAQDYGSTEIRLIMNEADAVIGPPRAAARKFAKARGYDLRWRDTVQPRARATGTKALAG